MLNYSKEMNICLDLAQKGAGKTSPNPMVGCVILDKKGRIVSKGYHHKFGDFHAERDALNKLDNGKGYTLVVNLEPCCHYGKTPPCTDIIIEKGIKRIVYGMKDPNPLVSGKGLQILKNHGLEIIGPILEDKCIELNEVFIKNQMLNKTFVAIKTATTIDGKIATAGGNSKWITSQAARNKGKLLRSYYDAILTSSSTVIADNPTMEHQNKIILDRELKTNLNSNIYKTGNIFIFCEKPLKSKSGNIKYIKTPIINNKLDIIFILNKIYELGIMSVFIEAGGILSASFLPYADKLYHFIAPKILADNSGKSCFEGLNQDKISQCFLLKYNRTEILESDILNIYTK